MRASLTLGLLLLFAPALAADSLIDRIWSVDRDRFVSIEELRAATQDADIVLLGEIHDNADHHRLQAEMLIWAAAGEPGVVFEMIGPEQADALEAWQAQPEPDPEELGPAVGWAERGWPDWSIYLPIAESAVEAGLPLFPGAPAHGMFQRVVREGLADALTGEQAAGLGLDSDLPTAARRALEERLERAHCGIDGHIPLERMVDAQRLRDASMARALVDVHDRRGGAILIAGNGHVHRGYGVPHYLEALRADLEVVSVGLLPAEGMERDAEGRPDTPELSAFDYVHFTRGLAPTTRPCEEEA